MDSREPKDKERFGKEEQPSRAEGEESLEEAQSGRATAFHLTTFAHGGRFWDVSLEFVEDPGQPDSVRGRLCFLPSDPAEGEGALRTAVIIIEGSHQVALERARALDRYQLTQMLRSVRP